MCTAIHDYHYANDCNDNNRDDQDNNNLNAASHDHNTRTAMTMRAWQQRPRGSLTLLNS
jgi:hypothetical protein